jgi:branched-chain amino acid transport system permease protein
MSHLFDIYLLEAVINGVLFGGLLALLSLGLNLVFGVIEVIWICYGELIMVGMYSIWWLFKVVGLPLPLAMLVGVLFVALLGAALHQFIIRPVLNADPINQLLVTGGVLFFLQAAATVVFGIEYRNIGVNLPSLNLGEISVSLTRIIGFVVALAAIAVTYVFLSRTYVGTAIRAISQDRTVMPLMGVNPATIYLVTSAIGGALAALASCLLVLQYDMHPTIGLAFGPVLFIICILGGLGNLVGGFLAAFVIAQFISVGGYFFQSEWGYVIAFVFFIVAIFIKPAGLFAKKR